MKLYLLTFALNAMLFFAEWCLELNSFIMFCTLGNVIELFLSTTDWNYFK